MKLIPATTLRERVADELRTSILLGNLSPGDELKQDRLAEEFGVSRIPIREALLMLENDGLIIVKPNRRVVVAPLTGEDIADHYAVRALIEGEAAARAAARKGMDLSGLTASMALNEAAVQSQDLAGFLASSEDFHRLIWDMAGGVHLKKVANQLWSGRDYPPDKLSRSLERTGDEHRLISEAIQLGDADAARHLMSGHITHIAEELQNYREQARIARRLDVQGCP